MAAVEMWARLRRTWVFFLIARLSWLLVFFVDLRRLGEWAWSLAYFEVSEDGHHWRRADWEVPPLEWDDDDDDDDDSGGIPIGAPA